MAIAQAAQRQGDAGRLGKRMPPPTVLGHARQYARWALLAVMGLFTAAASAATLTVTNLNDDGAGSLRAQIAAAAAGDTINFSVTGTIKLASTLTISQNLTISGPGAANLTVSGENSTTRNIYVTAGSVTISGLTIANGHDSSTGGAGLRSESGTTVNLSDCVFDSNEAAGTSDGGAMASRGTIAITRCTFRGNSADLGGALYLDGATATVTDSVLDSNSATYGGGILAGASLVISNTTFRSNRADFDGGALYLAGTTPIRYTTIRNTTFSGNHADGNGGAIICTGNCNLAVRNSTLAGNDAGRGAGGLALDDPSANATVAATIFSGNTVATSGAGAIYFLGIGDSDSRNSHYNLFYGNKVNGVDDDTIGYGTANYVYTTTAPLAALADNGGPTQTMMPVASSAALDRIAAGTLCPATDQRGVARPQTAAGYAGSTPCDIGAVERRAAASTLGVTVVGAGSVTAAPAPTGTGSSGGISGCTSSGGAACAATYFAENNIPGITLTASPPASGYALIWSGTGCVPVSGNSLQAMVTMDQNRSCTATYSQMTLTLPVGTYGAPYNQTLSASGGTAPYTYVLTSGSLPAGLALNNAVLSGTPAAAGSFANFVITATDRNGFSVQLSTLTINQASQTITGFAPTTPVVFGAAAQTLSATGGASGNAVTFSVLSGPCNVSGSSLSYTGAGTCVIAADQAGNANYSAAPQVTASVVVNQASQTITFGPPPSLLVLGSATVTATGGGSGNAVIFSSTTPTICSSGGTNGATIAGILGGSCVIAANQAGNANYTAAPQVTQTLVVGAAGTSMTLTASPTAINVGERVTFVATVTPVAAQASAAMPGVKAGTQINAIPTGNVLFSDNGSPMATVALDGNGQASYSTTALIAGVHRITASYAGDASNVSATANAAVAVQALPVPALREAMLGMMALLLAAVAGLALRARRRVA